MSTKAMHTPGPWFHNRTATPAKAVWNTRGARSDDERELIICSAVGYHEKYQPPENEIDANMQLISAAPDLLAACETVKNWCELNDRTGSVIYKRVCAAIDKAKGGA